MNFAEHMKREAGNFFFSLPKKILLRKDIQLILHQNRRTWKIPKNVRLNEFLNALLENKFLKEIKVTVPNYEHSYPRYAINDPVPIYQLALSLRPNAYFSHQTALRLHGLTKHEQKLLYLNAEQSKKPPSDSSLSQDNIDRAFKNHARKSNYFFHYENFKICLLTGKNTGNLGVEEVMIDGETLLVTNLERTLIDIAVRPGYSGGCAEVLNAFRNAKSKVSVNKLVKMLRKINYIYPYHQAIGFYMDKAGFEELDLIKLRTGMQYDFYLDYAMKKKEYSKIWRIYYPSNL